MAPYGAVSWVLNLRASGEAALTRGKTTRRFTVREASPEEAGPLLKSYLESNSTAKAYFAAAPGDPVDAFVAEAERHPVFQLTESHVG